MRKYLTILLVFSLCSFSKKGFSQQHLTKGWSISGGTILNAKGGNTTLHYHLNSFDELRLNFYGIRQSYFLPANDNELSLKTSSLSVDFAKGYKFQHLKKMTVYLGGGFFWGREKTKNHEVPTNNLFGISLFQETEYAPFNQLALFARVNMLIPFGLARSKSLRLALGGRFYF